MLENEIMYPIGQSPNNFWETATLHLQWLIFLKVYLKQ